MVNLYKLLNALEQGMTLFQLDKWKTEGIWYPISQHKENQIKYPKAYIITKYLIYLLLYNILIEYLFKVIL